MTTTQLASTVSSERASEWRGDITMFRGALSTLPSQEWAGVGWSAFVAILAPSEPQILANKALGPFFLPSLLKNAPLVGRTLEWAIASGKATIGKMRSASHVNSGAWLKLDIDGMSKADFKALREELRRHGIAYCLYSTHSFGFKPGVRARLILPLDRPLGPVDYMLVSCAGSTTLIGASLDPSEGRLHQLAGGYVAHPDRRHFAFREVVEDGFCLSSDALLRIAAQTTPKAPQAQIKRASAGVTERERRQIESALKYIDASNYSTWMRIGNALKVALGSEGVGVWLDFSSRGATTNGARNDESQYNPQSIFERLNPTMPIDAALGTIFGAGRDGAVALVRSIRDSEMPSTEQLGAVEYLSRYHPKLSDELLKSELGV